MKSKKIPGTLSLAWKIGLIVLLIAVSLTALGIGRFSVTPRDIFRSVTGHLTGGEVLNGRMETVLWKIRAPRILLAILCGAGLSVAGCVFQSVFANPLATPDTLGVASGASFGAALALLLGFEMIGVQAVSLFFGLAAVLLTYLVGQGKGRGQSSTVLSGIMMGSLFSALVSLVKFTADTETTLPAITYWLMGSLESASYDTLKVGAPLIVVSICILASLRWRLNVLPLEDDEARATGVNIRALRAVTVICASAMTAACISMCGQVGWIGLIVPHICRMKFGSNHNSLIPSCGLLGASFCVIVDTLARSISASEIPISILTAIIGAPFFIILMRRTRGWQI